MVKKEKNEIMNFGELLKFEDAVKSTNNIQFSKIWTLFSMLS